MLARLEQPLKALSSILDIFEEMLISSTILLMDLEVEELEVLKGIIEVLIGASTSFNVSFTSGWA